MAKGNGKKKKHIPYLNLHSMNMIQSYMRKMNWKIGDLRDGLDKVGRTDGSYEIARRLTNGLGRPSKYNYDIVAKLLGIPTEEVVEVMRTDEILEKYGVVPKFFTDKNPELFELEGWWPLLSKEQKDQIISMTRLMGKEKMEEIKEN